MRHTVLPLLVLSLLTSCRQEALVGLRDDGDASVNVPRADASVTPDATAPPAVVTIDDCGPTNTAGLDATNIAKLIGGGQGTAPIIFLYPYAETVFPGSGPAPLVMWNGTAADAVHVRLHSRRFDYRLCTVPTAPNRLQIPQAAWDAASKAAGGESDPFELTLTTLGAGVATGPATERIVIASAPLPGSVYYTSTDPPTTGRVTRITSRGEQLPFIGGLGCAGCHTPAANGTRFIGYTNGTGVSYTESAAAPAVPLGAPAPGAEFAGVHPSGSLYVASAHQAGNSPRGYGASTLTSALYEMDTGTLVAGSGIPPGATMPAFSPDGARLVFDDVTTNAAHSLTVMEFSTASRAASNARTVFSDPARYPGWPTFLPDGRAVVFALGTTTDFSANGMGLLVKPPPGPASDLFVVNIGGETPAMTGVTLYRAMGFASADDAEAGTPYPPIDPSELHQAYYPFVAPVVAGGYAWVFFDTYRRYGNAGAHRAIWGTALTLSPSGTYVSDPSHPAFYLSGQDALTANFRAIPALDPCAPEDAACARLVTR